MSTDQSVPLVIEDTRRAECPRSDSCHENLGGTSIGRIEAICRLVMAMVFAFGKRDRVVFIGYNTGFYSVWTGHSIFNWFGRHVHVTRDSLSWTACASGVSSVRSAFITSRMNLTSCSSL